MLPNTKAPFRPHTRMLDLLNRKSAVLLFLEHFEVDFRLGNKTVRQICREYNIDEEAFILIGNLYNGILPEAGELCNARSLDSIINFLHSSHQFYKEDKYPEIMDLLASLHEDQHSKDAMLLEQFFKDYFQEVLEHLAYEEEIAFPYFRSLLDKGNEWKGKDYSAGDYMEHHSDIESKLEDLKNLMLKHISIKGRLNLKRRFLNSLFELEFDLKTHSMIEEEILVPLVEKLEKDKIDG